VAECSAKKLKGAGKKNWPEGFKAELWPNLPLSGKKGLEENLLMKFLILK
jgi:hypothetical protein